jgi:protoporphyrinogen oxidase
VCLASGVTRIQHDNSRITAIEINGKEVISIDEMISTLPISCFVNLLAPTPPGHILSAEKKLRFRHVLLVAVFLDKNSVTDAASVYFPDSRYPFSRIYEPKNRDARMAPPGKTSLVAEIPCWQTDGLWTETDEDLTSDLCAHLMKLGWIKQQDITGSCVKRIECAYPVLELGFEQPVRDMFRYLDRFTNLNINGRNGRFEYTWIHNMMRQARDTVETYLRPVPAG